MPLFGRKKRRSASDANYSTTHLPQAQFAAPPPPYQQYDLAPPQPRPYHYPPASETHLPLQPSRTGPYQYHQPSRTTLPLRQAHTGPYQNPQPSRTVLPLRQAHTGPYQQSAPWTSQTQLQKWSSSTNIPAIVSSCHAASRVLDHCISGKGLYEYIGDRFSNAVSLIDEEIFPAGEQDLIITLDDAPAPYSSPYPQQNNLQLALRGGGVDREKDRSLWPSRHRENHRPPDKAHDRAQAYAQAADRTINVRSKVSLYANSRLPPTSALPPLRLYTASWPLICLAARYSNNAYNQPRGSEKDTFVRPDDRLGTKAMVIKSVPVDDMNTIVFAIRGTSLLSPRDWGVNLSTTPVSPRGFLDDEGNLVHGGFLRVAKAMIPPIAARLRNLLQENPSRSACSLLITGHSAGGAVAALLYAHMLAESSATRSELNILTGCFKRIHCITFGAPPLTLLPLWKPASQERRLRKSLFLSFINEGDVVSRAEKSYVLSVIELLASPSPQAVRQAMGAGVDKSKSRLDLSKHSRHPRAIWKVPPATLSNAGRLVVLRVPDGAPERAVTASIVTDEQLRGLVFGDVFVHAMAVYHRRIDSLAVNAVTGGGV